MKLLNTTLSFLLFSQIVSFSAHAQKSIDSTINENTKFELINDTLISPFGLKIFSGQKFTLGNGVGINGRYRSIISKYAAIVPNIWGNNNNYENMIENYVDSKKGKKQTEALVSGQVFIIGKILKMGKKKFQFYFTNISSKDYNYSCDILLALRLKELWFQ